MGSPLGPVLAGIFMVHLEMSLVPLLTAELSFWKRYVDNTITFIKIATVDHILSMLNTFHTNIQLTCETEYNIKLAFLDFMLCRGGENIVITVYRKVTNAGVYRNWNSFAPHSWKRGTLKTVTRRAYMICSTTELLDTELKHLVFTQVFTQVEFVNDTNLSLPTIELIEVPANENETVTKKHMLLLPYQADKGIGLTKSLKRNLNKHLPDDIKTQVTFTGQKLSTQFNVKDRTKFEHKYDLFLFW